MTRIVIMVAWHPAALQVGGRAVAVIYLVPIHKWPICPISVLREKFNPRNINPMPAVKFFARLDLDQICEGTNGCPSISGWTLPNRFFLKCHVPSCL